MTSPDQILEIWPATWRETAVRANQLFSGLAERACTEGLSLEELDETSRAVDHLRHAWDRSWRNPVVSRGVNLLQNSLATKFGVPQNLRPRDKCNRILDATLPTGYFNEGKSVELKAMGIIMARRFSRRDMHTGPAIEDLALEIVRANLTH